MTLPLIAIKRMLSPLLVSHIHAHISLKALICFGVKIERPRLHVLRSCSEMQGIVSSKKKKQDAP